MAPPSGNVKTSPTPDFGRSWEGIGLSDSGPNAAKSGSFKTLDKPIGTIGHGTGQIPSGKGSGGFIPTGSDAHPGAFGTRLAGTHHAAAPKVRFMAGAAPLAKPAKAEPPPPGPKVATTGVEGGKRTYGLTETPAQVTLKGNNGAKTQLTATYHPDATHTEPLKAGGRTVYLTSDDMTTYKLMSQIYGKSTTRVA